MSLPISIKEVPFFRLIVPFIAGIACQYWLVKFSFSLWWYTLVLLLLGLVFISFFLASHWRFRWLFGIAVNIFLFFFGIVITIKQPISDKLIVRGSNSSIIYLLDNPQLRARSLRAQVELRYLQNNNRWESTNEKILVYFEPDDSLALNLSYGSVIAANLVPQTITQSGNPYQFDFKKYLSDRGIYHSAYLKHDDWVLLGNEGVGIKKKALLLRDKLVSLFRKYGLSGDELAVASALTLGYQDLLDDELRQVYSSSGAMHILSVSGLHVGILYIMLTFLLSFLDKRVFTRAIKVGILLLFLWFFALLTGLPPCVQRSAMMFSFVVIGDFFKRKSNIYNILSASAFVLLAINPFNLLDIGFQLSYLAVLSIVFFYPYIYKMIYVKGWMLDKVWSLIAVSIAAQFGTFSICLFYFNQFPNYFLLANLIAIPLSTIALYLAVLLIVVSPIPVIAGFTGEIFSFIITLLNSGLEYIENLPYSVSQGINLSALQMFIVIGCIVFLSIYLLSKRVRYLFATLILVGVFLGLEFNYRLQKAKKNEFVVYNINRKSLVSFRSNEELLFIDVDTSKNLFQEKYNFFVKGYISEVGAIKNYEIVNPTSREIANEKSSFVRIHSNQGVSLVSFNNKIIAIPYEKSLDKMICNKKMRVDYLLINKFYPYSVFNFFKPKMVIIDSSASKHTITDVSQKCNQQNIPYYVTSLQGAFVLNLTDG